jgi:hypothetical protein
MPRFFLPVRSPILKPFFESLSVLFGAGLLGLGISGKI